MPDIATEALETAVPLVEPEEQTTHVEALKASSIIGGSTLIVMLIRMVRTKFVAVLLGPAGVGVEAVYDSIVTMARIIFESGLGTPGVRQIAAASDDRAVARTVFTLRRACIVLGIAGAAVVFFGSAAISRATFGDTSQSQNIRLLSLAILFSALATGWGALLTGMRRIRDLAGMNIWGTLIGVGVSIPLMAAWGIDAIALYMVVGGGAGALIAWAYARRVLLPKITMTGREVTREAGKILRFGLAFVATSFMSTGALLILRVMVARTEGVEAAGLFQAASALSMVYLGFILQAMGTDYFPRLTAVAHDDRKANRVVNEQAEISLLLAVPGILATLAVTPLLIEIFYSAEFDVAGDLLAWLMTGMFFRIVSWPIGFVLPARGNGVTFVLTDVVAWTSYVAFSWWGLQAFGLVGVGVAFLGMYLLYTTLIYGVVRSLTGFRWSTPNLRLIVLGSASIGLVLFARFSLPAPWAMLWGLLLALMVGLYCLRDLVRIVGAERVGDALKRVMPKWPTRPGRER